MLRAAASPFVFYKIKEKKLSLFFGTSLRDSTYLKLGHIQEMQYQFPTKVITYILNVNPWLPQDYT